MVVRSKLGPCECLEDAMAVAAKRVGGMTVEAVVRDLRSRGKENTKAIYGKHGMALDRTLGVSIADLKLIAKTIKGQQALACELYATGVFEAMYLAGIVADGAKMSREEVEAWAAGSAGMPMIAEYTVPWVTVDRGDARELAMGWIGSDGEHVECAGWRTYAGLATTRADGELDLAEMEGLLEEVVGGIGGAKNRVRAAMNGFVIAVACYVKPLAGKAKAAAKKIGKVSVDVGDTDCKVSVASEVIAKVEGAGKAGVKRKTIRC